MAAKKRSKKQTLKEAVDVLRDPSGDGSTKMTHGFVGEDPGPEPDAAEDESKSPRLVELLELEADLRSALDAIDIEHRQELVFNEEPRCSEEFEAEIDEEIHRGVEELAVPLSEAEQLEASNAAATALFAQHRLEDLKKSASDMLKKLTDLYEKRVSVLLGQVKSKRAFVPVRIIIVRSADGLHAETLRCDTGEVVRVRELTNDERQLKIA